MLEDEEVSEEGDGEEYNQSMMHHLQMKKPLKLNKKRCWDRKPAIILDYNHNKRSVDNLDKVIGTYSRRRMTSRWPLVIFHNIINVSSYNAFVLWTYQPYLDA